jgi:hypothetical protein
MFLKKRFTHDFRHTAINQLWRLISGPAILILIPVYLSAVAQGYWFTFISLSALAVFADLGFTTIILQFSAHEFAHLHFNEHKQLAGQQAHLHRISSLFRFALGWSLKISLLVFPVILIAGYIVLSQKRADVVWLTPWLVYGTASALAFVNNIVLSFMEGCDSVGDAQKIRFHVGVVNVVLMMLGLIAGLKLFALAIALLGSASAGSFLIIKKYRVVLRQLHSVAIEDCRDWKGDILPLLAKYAVSWASGYFIFSIFTPLAFHYYGPIAAGKVGLSIALWTAVFGISNIWMTVIMPKMNMLIAKGDYASLNPIFYRHLKLAVATFILGMVTVFSIYFILNGRYAIVNRFLSPMSLLVIALCWLMQVIISGLAAYMRAHKEEPLVMPSFASGVYISLTTWLIAMYWPFEYFFAGFLSSFLWGLPWTLMIFQKYKARMNDETGLVHESAQPDI